VRTAIIYGSFARGEVREHSDLDLILVLSNGIGIEEHFDPIRYIREFSTKERLLDVILLTEGDWRRGVGALALSFAITEKGLYKRRIGSAWICLKSNGII